MIESSYQPNTLSNKLQTFHAPGFSEFVTEFKKQNVKLSKQAEFDLLDLFEAQKSQALDLQQQVERTDQDIDNMAMTIF